MIHFLFTFEDFFSFLFSSKMNKNIWQLKKPFKSFKIFAFCNTAVFKLYNFVIFLYLITNIGRYDNLLLHRAPHTPNPPTKPLSPSNRLYKLCIVVLAILHTTVTNRLKFRAGSRLNLTNWPSKFNFTNQSTNWLRSIDQFPARPYWTTVRCQSSTLSPSQFSYPMLHWLQMFPGGSSNFSDTPPEGIHPGQI